MTMFSIEVNDDCQFTIGGRDEKDAAEAASHGPVEVIGWEDGVTVFCTTNMDVLRVAEVD